MGVVSKSKDTSIRVYTADSLPSVDVPVFERSNRPGGAGGQGAPGVPGGQRGRGGRDGTEFQGREVRAGNPGGGLGMPGGGLGAPGGGPVPARALPEWDAVAAAIASRGQMVRHFEFRMARPGRRLTKLPPVSRTSPTDSPRCLRRATVLQVGGAGRLMVGMSSDRSTSPRRFPTPAPTLARPRHWPGRPRARNVIDMIGVGPFVTIPRILSTMHGRQAMLGWIFGALLCVCDGRRWAELGAAMPQAGGPVRCLCAMYGPRVGGWLAFLFVFQLTFSAPLSMASGCHRLRAIYGISLAGAAQHHCVAAFRAANPVRRQHRRGRYGDERDVSGDGHRCHRGVPALPADQRIGKPGAFLWLGVILTTCRSSLPAS